MKPEEGLYINAHGTSTKLNDASETRGFKQALGEEAARAAHVSSTKSMTGHMIGATGAVEAMACALALENEAKECQLTWAISTNLGFGGHNAALALRAAGRE